MMKVLGPTAAYLGEGIKLLTQKQIENVFKIFKQASEKIDACGLKGSIPPRILKHILEEGAYVDNELAAEYLSGVFAASKSEQQRDDRALTFLKILSNMSNYEIRLHYIIYSSFRHVFLNSNEFNVTLTDKCTQSELFFPLSQFIESFALEEGEDINVILEHALPGLATRNLINANWSYGNKDFMKTKYKFLDSDGIIASPSLLGSQIYLAAHGNINTPANKLCDSSIELKLWNEIQPVKGVIRTKTPFEAGHQS